MVGTVANSPTSDAYLDGMMFTKKLASTSLTVSYPTAGSNYGASYNLDENITNFEAFNATQIAAHRKMLAMYAQYTPFVFTEMTETDSEHADLRFAMSDIPATAHAYAPWDDVSARIGDAWFRNTGGNYDSPDFGNFAWMQMLHETGHTLGLDHPHEGGSGFVNLPSDADWIEHAVMSYRSREGGGTGSYTVETGGFAITPMERDIAVLQHLYGANTTIRPSGTEYEIVTDGTLTIDGVEYVNPLGEPVLYTMPWHTGGVNTLKMLNCTGDRTVDLRPGMGWILSQAQRSVLASGFDADACIYNPPQYGSGIASFIQRFIPGTGTVTVIGNSGPCTLALTGTRSQYTKVKNLDGTYTYTDNRGGTPNGICTVQDFDFIEFSDITVTPDASVNIHRVSW